MSDETLPDGKGGVTALRLSRPAPGVLYVQVRGHLGTDTARRIIVYASQVLEEDSAEGITAHHDWYAVTNYDTEARRLLTNFGKATEASIRTSHILLKSKVVAMGVNVANALLGNLVAYSSRAAFLAALEARIRAAGRRTASQQ